MGFVIGFRRSPVRRSVLTALLGLALVGCQAGPGASPSAAPTTGAQPTAGSGQSAAPEPSASLTPLSLKLALNWPYPVSDWSGFVWALQEGYYEEENLTLELEYTAGSAPAIQAVGAGTANVGLGDPTSVLQSIETGAPVVVVANHIQATPSGVLSLQEAGITDYEDLRGKKVGVSISGGFEVALLQGILKEHGLTQDVTLEFVDAQARCTLVLSKAVDACTGFSTFQQIQMEGQGATVNFVPFSTDEAPILGAGIFANRDWLASNGEAMKRFLRATQRGYIESVKDLDKSTELMLELYPEGDGPLYKRGLEVFKELYSSPLTETNGWGWMADDPWNNLQTQLVEGDVLKALIPVGDIYTNDYLSEDRSAF